jgi:hypothetical protein
MKQLLLLATLTGAAFAATPAHAGDRLNHSAHFCVATSGTPTIGWGGGISNASSTNEMRVFCPVVRDGGATSTGDAIVHTIDRKAGDGIDCSFYSARAYSQSWHWSGWIESVGSGEENYRTFSWDSVAHSDDWSGHHHFHCLVPTYDNTYGASVVVSYSTGDS